MKRVLIVDDYEPNLRLYAAVIKRVTGEEPLAFDEPQLALKQFKAEQPSLVIVDYQMPEMNGVALIREIRALDAGRDTPIVMLTSMNERDLQQRAMAAGATLFLEKPVPLRDFMTHIRRFVPPQRHDEIPLDGTSGDRDAIVRLHRALQTRDPVLAERVRRTRDVAVALANELRLAENEVELLRIAGLVYDIGMLAVPDKALAAPWELSAHWTTVMREHVNAGSAILSGGQSPVMTLAETLALRHHEHFDGSGYPDRLSGDEIPFLARLLAVADAFTAMTSERPYRVEMSASGAIAEIKAASGSTFDPRVVSALEAIKDPPVGTRRSA